jgi:3-methyl-2-oxobutanoate hydroxymethyltransferase
MNSVRDFARFKAEGRKISIVTAYDSWSARLVARSLVDAVLVGDSAAMVMHGHPTTLPATVGLIALHTSAVTRSAAGKFLIADLPFLSFRKGVRAAMTAVGALMTRRSSWRESMATKTSCVGLSARACPSWDTLA